MDCYWSRYVDGTTLRLAKLVQCNDAEIGTWGILDYVDKAQLGPELILWITRHNEHKEPRVSAWMQLHPHPWLSRQGRFHFLLRQISCRDRRKD